MINKKIIFQCITSKMSRKFVSQSHTPNEKSIKQRVPTNASQVDTYLTQLESSVPIGNVQGRQIRNNIFQQVSPIYPRAPSANWATDTNYKGWNQDDLNTYIIRQSDKNTVRDFDRFILKTDNEAEDMDLDTPDQNKENELPEDIPKNLAYMIRHRIGNQNDNSAKQIKHSESRKWINGNTSNNVMTMDTKLEKRKRNIF
jgi:hypothetical protein